MAETHYIGGREPGQGRYALAEMVGRGGFATVWRARPVDGAKRDRRGYLALFGGGVREVAVKVIPVYSRGERYRALREGQIAMALRHKNIVETLEVIPGDLEVYLVTEFVRGMPLDAAARHYDVGGVVDALAQILEALSYAHSRGVIHRDIKPQNALVDDRGRVKLTDFGVAYRAGDTRLTQVGYAVGTPGYIAPEILDGEDPTVLTDIYAVGATARALLSRLPDEPPRRLLEFVNRATSPNPTYRPQDAADALYLLADRREDRRNRAGLGDDAAEGAPKREKVPNKKKRFAGGALRIVNGALAGWLGYLGAGLFLDPSQAMGVAAGFGLLGCLLPRLGALCVVVALAVVLVRSGQAGLGGAALLPVAGGLWVAAGSVSRDVGRLPLGPVLAVPLTAYGLGAGLPLFFGALMRPLGAALSAAAAALLLVAHALLFGDGVVPYLGIFPGNLAAYSGPVELLGRGEALLEAHPALPLLAALWAAMALLVAASEWMGRWAVGLALAAGGGAFGYYALPALAEPGLLARPEAPAEAMTSLAIAAIIYGVIKYLGSLFR